MSKRFRPGIVSISDAVYKDEASNKIVIAGLYSGNIVTEGGPSDLRFALYAEFFVPDAEEHDLDIQFWVGKRQVGGARSQVKADDPSLPLAIMLSQFSLGVGGATLPATLRIKAVLDAGNPLIVLEKKIIPRNPTATASPPLAARSRRVARAKA